ncbi:MAG: GNAT family N-acetyltransferase [Oscillospiraceae bacterium]|nr:GNAT family N-acetyltransferase [Oscillospiraceae bacterium]
MKLIDITKENYVQVAMLTTNEDMKPTVLERYVTSNAFSMAQSKYSDKWITKAVEQDGSIIGFAMYGPTDLNGETVFQLCRFMIDIRSQGKGYGKEALKLILDEMKQLDGCNAVYLSIEPENERARHIYEQAGFVCLDMEICGELLFKLAF